MKIKYGFLIISTVVLSTFLYNNAFASGGFLNSSSIKTCPNGKTYGSHGSDDHWHLAQENSNGSFSPIGSEIRSDPCPKQVEATVPPASKDSETEKEPIKSSNTKISRILVNGVEAEGKLLGDYTAKVTHSDGNMISNINSDNIEIRIDLEDASAKYEIEKPVSEEKGSEHHFIYSILVTAENGDTKSYSLDVEYEHVYDMSNPLTNVIIIVICVLFYGGIGFVIYKIVKKKKTKNENQNRN